MLIKTSYIKKYGILLSALLLGACIGNQPEDSVINEMVAPVKLTVGEGFNEPLGYYEQQPRFSWKIADNSSLMTQTAYQIQVAAQPSLFDTDTQLWDSQKVLSNKTSWIKYQGKPLTSRQKLYWRVRQWGKDDLASTWSVCYSRYI